MDKLLKLRVWYYAAVRRHLTASNMTSAPAVIAFIVIVFAFQAWLGWRLQ